MKKESKLTANQIFELQVMGNVAYKNNKKAPCQDKDFLTFYEKNYSKEADMFIPCCDAWDEGWWASYRVAANIEIKTHAFQ